MSESASWAKVSPTTSASCAPARPALTLRPGQVCALKLRPGQVCAPKLRLDQDRALKLRPATGDARAASAYHADHYGGRARPPTKRGRHGRANSLRSRW
jgi:hypothetical protein